VFSDLVLYETLIVPRLPRWQSVPLVWWALVELPVIVAIIVVGSMTRGVKTSSGQVQPQPYQAPRMLVGPRPADSRDTSRASQLNRRATSG
jgi:hypothetical protein